EQNTDISCNTIPMISSTNLSHISGEWVGTMNTEKNFLPGIICLLLAPVAVPLWVLFYVYLSAFIVLIYEMTIATVKLQRDYSTTCKIILAYLWDIFGRIWHGYELHGVENLPDGPGLLIYYHAALPLDYIFFLSRLFLLKGIHCRTVVDHFTFKLPGFKRLLQQLLMMSGTKDDCFSVLKEGHLVAISPGGTREAMFSDETYKIIWGKRTGFAQLAIDAKVPIIPMFTQNVREGYRTFGKTKMLEKLYEYARWPVVIFYGGLPVKWRTYLGEPIPYDPDITSEELAQKTKTALQNLIDKHQKRPGGIREALLERFHSHRKRN
ncbi:hypothetical protein JRQ81_012733, partial [Phrynocephalus forsythii]